MGLFDFAKNFMGASSDNNHHDYSLKEYGVAAVYWSADYSRNLFDSILQIPHPREEDWSLIARIENYPSSAETVFFGLYAAAYLVYATKLLGFESEAERNEIIAGVNEGFTKLSSLGSSEEKQNAIHNFMSSVSLFYPAIARDIYRNEPKDEETYLMAVKIFERLHGKEYKTSDASYLEQMRLYHVFQGEPITLIDAVKKLSERSGNKIRFRLEI
jgi:hypothetical protein